MALTIVVEDGTGVTGANAYESVANTATRVADFGRTGFASLTADQQAAATYRGTLRLESALQNHRITGAKVSESQGLSYPRLNCYLDGELADSTKVPGLVLDLAALEADAVGREIADGDPDYVPPGAKRMKASGSEVEYFASGTGGGGAGDPEPAALLRRLVARPRR